MRLATVILATSGLLAFGSSCSRDQIAPDCFFEDANGCLPPAGGPGGGALALECGMPPVGAIGAQYSHTVASFSGPQNAVFQADGLPAGLSMAGGGQIVGVPEETGTFSATVTVTDTESGRSVSDTCSDFIVENRLDHDLFDLPDLAPLGCVPVGGDIDNHLIGGDGTPVTCSMETGDSDGCPNGDGNGIIPDGVSFDPQTCMSSGTPNDEHGGTYAWIVRVEQSGVVLHVPFCATQPVDGFFHDVDYLHGGMSRDLVAPLIVSYDPEAPLSLGNGMGTDPQVEVTAACPDQSCNFWGYTVSITCSPFDPPFDFENSGALFDDMNNRIGFFHGTEVSTQGMNVGDQPNGNRTWIVHFREWYCTTTPADEALCDKDIGNNVKDNAQTRYTWPVIAVPQ